MTAHDDIIAGKFKDSLEWKEALHAAGGAGGGATATLFANFVGYASASWDYAAKGGPLASASSPSMGARASRTGPARRRPS